MKESGYYPQEEWKTIRGFNNYKINRDGVVHNQYGKPLLQKPNKKGYLRVWLNNEEIKHKQFFVHRLVAEAFLLNPTDLPYINHKDECKQNNNVDNLEWCDNTYNQRYSHALKINQYDTYGNLLKCWDAVSDIEISLGFATTNISKCCKGKIKTSNGFIFLYDGDNIQQRLLDLKKRKHKSKTESRIYELQ